MSDQTPSPENPQPAATPPAPARHRKSGLSPEILGAAALGLSIIALGTAALPYVGGGFGDRVRTYLLSNPQVLDEILEARQIQQEVDAVSAINAAVQKNPALLAVDARDPAFGPADAKVTVIEYFDFRCPGCKAVAPEYRALMQAHPDVRFVFKDWPILDSAQNQNSQYAARAALAAHRQGKYLAVYDALMATPVIDQEQVDRILREAGVDMAAARAALVSDDMTRHITDTHTGAAAMGLRGTPTFFVNGRAAPNIEPAAVAAMIEQAKAG